MSQSEDLMKVLYNDKFNKIKKDIKKEIIDYMGLSEDKIKEIQEILYGQTRNDDYKCFIYEFLIENKKVFFCGTIYIHDINKLFVRIGSIGSIGSIGNRIRKTYNINCNLKNIVIEMIEEFKKTI